MPACHGMPPPQGDIARLTFAGRQLAAMQLTPPTCCGSPLSNCQRRRNAGCATDTGALTLIFHELKNTISSSSADCEPPAFQTANQCCHGGSSCRSNFHTRLRQRAGCRWGAAPAAHRGNDHPCACPAASRSRRSAQLPLQPAASACPWLPRLCWCAAARLGCREQEGGQTRLKPVTGEGKSQRRLSSHVRAQQASPGRRLHHPRLRAARSSRLLVACEQEDVFQQLRLLDAHQAAVAGGLHGCGGWMAAAATVAGGGEEVVPCGCSPVPKPAYKRSFWLPGLPAGPTRAGRAVKSGCLAAGALGWHAAS